MTESDETNGDEIELLTLDDRKLTPQQWEHFKRRAQDARAQAMHDLSRAVLSSLRDAATGGWDFIRACGHWGAVAAGKICRPSAMTVLISPAMPAAALVCPILALIDPIAAG